MADTRHKDVSWNLYTNSSGNITLEQVNVAVLMDIRDEMKQLNRLFHCSNFLEIPRILRTIRRNTTKRRYKKT